ncbi:hypothetical protein D3C86_1930220 [compost metagenome]
MPRARKAATVVSAVTRSWVKLYSWAKPAVSEETRRPIANKTTPTVIRIHPIVYSASCSASQNAFSTDLLVRLSWFELD